ncbi:MAG: aminoacyl-tRNA hydrolase [Candidatus Pacebacteria bacterium]|nr:aminoacyl-tRNA hydrolase [Candidatus Paceibacterota bacterium]
MYTIVGLGNPGKEYAMTRHNTGRIMLDYFAKSNDFSDWNENKKYKSLVSEGKLDKEKVILLKPETFMNKSGLSVKDLIDKDNAGNLIVIYDDLDLGLGDFKISFNRGTGGHNGLESIVKTIKTKEFTRIRVGICPTTPTGKLKKPKGEEKVLNLIMKDFKKPELDVLKKISKRINIALEMIVKEGRDKAMNEFN